MFLTITSLIVASMFGVAFTAAWRLSNINENLLCKNKDLKEQLGRSQRMANEINERFESLANANESEYVSYFVNYKNNTAVVLRRSFSNGREFHTFIKSFDDEDMEFNQHEAEELCEILNSK